MKELGNVPKEMAWCFLSLKIRRQFQTLLVEIKGIPLLLSGHLFQAMVEGATEGHVEGHKEQCEAPYTP